MSFDAWKHTGESKESLDSVPSWCSGLGVHTGEQTLCCITGWIHGTGYVYAVQCVVALAPHSAYLSRILRHPMSYTTEYQEMLAGAHYKKYHIFQNNKFLNILPSITFIKYQWGNVCIKNSLFYFSVELEGSSTCYYENSQGNRKKKRAPFWGRKPRRKWESVIRCLLWKEGM